jgi:hypothetical protein
MKKYEFTSETKLWFGRTLHRIRAVIAFGDVAVGDLGGWIEKEDNLSHDDQAWVCDEARVCGEALVCDEARVCGEALVCDEARVYGKARVYGEARVCKQEHWLSVGPIGSRNDFTTFFRTKNMEIFVTCGCFRGNIEAFEAKVKLTHGDSNHAKVYLAAIELAKARISMEE